MKVGSCYSYFTLPFLLHLTNKEASQPTMSYSWGNVGTNFCSLCWPIFFCQVFNLENKNMIKMLFFTKLSFLEPGQLFWHCCVKQFSLSSLLPQLIHFSMTSYHASHKMSLQPVFNRPVSGSHTWHSINK